MLDPACGSGTFLFHAIRRKLTAAGEAGLTPAEAVSRCVAQVRGLDIHPVAVIIARVTWLLALGAAIERRGGELHVPVYLGDAMQWNLHQIGDVREVVVAVPDEAPLRVPAGFAEDQARSIAACRAGAGAARTRVIGAGRTLAAADRWRRRAGRYRDDRDL